METIISTTIPNKIYGIISRHDTHGLALSDDGLNVLASG